jgi:hypothetical protein
MEACPFAPQSEGAGHLGFRLTPEGQVREMSPMRQTPRGYTAGQSSGRALGLFSLFRQQTGKIHSAERNWEHATC